MIGFVFVAYLVDVYMEYYSPCLFFFIIIIMITVVMIFIFIDFYFGETLQHNVGIWKKKN